jgi:hypothetical protein
MDREIRPPLALIDEHAANQAMMAWLYEVNNLFSAC